MYSDVAKMNEREAKQKACKHHFPGPYAGIKKNSVHVCSKCALVVHTKASGYRKFRGYPAPKMRKRP
jgi:hypothetical protein